MDSGISLGVALGLFAVLCTTAGCAGARPARTVPVPEGQGWYCFSPHREGSLAPSCHRTRAECIRSVADAVSDRATLIAQEYSACEPQARAHCLAYRPRQGGATRWSCMASARDCESERAEVWPEFEIVSACERTE